MTGKPAGARPFQRSRGYPGAVGQAQTRAAGERGELGDRCDLGEARPPALPAGLAHDVAQTSDRGIRT